MEFYKNGFTNKYRHSSKLCHDKIWLQAQPLKGMQTRIEITLIVVNGSFQRCVVRMDFYKKKSKKVFYSNGCCDKKDNEGLEKELKDLSKGISGELFVMLQKNFK